MRANRQPRRIRNAMTARQRLARQITACWRTQALHAAVVLELPDQLEKTAGEVAALAQACGCKPDSLQRLLRALCALQVCREKPDGTFALTAAGKALCKSPEDGQVSMRALTLWWGGAMWPLWSDLPYSVRTGNSARLRQTGAAHYGFLEESADLATLFHQAMQAMTALMAEDIAALDLFSRVGLMVDVGGGNGALAATIAARHARLQVMVLDRADAKSGVTTDFNALLQSGRAAFVVGDFFANIPGGADCYLLKSILHNWDDEHCRKLLALCAVASRPGTRLLVVERIRPERLKHTHHDDAVCRTDLNMLLGLGGRERTLAEYSALLLGAGFAVRAVHPTQYEFSVMEAVAFN